MKKTRFMSKLFSDTDYQEKINAKIDEAHENGSASLEEDGENLQFADVEGDIIVEDKTDGMSEVTRISPNPDDDNDFIVTPVEVPAEFSEDADDDQTIEVTNSGEDDNSEEVNIDVESDDPDEKGFSLKFKNYSVAKAKNLAKLFSKVMEVVGEEEVKTESDILDDIKIERIPGTDGNSSDNLSSVEISRIPGADGDADDIVDDLEIEVKTGIEDEEKSGTNTYSLKFKNYSKKRAQMFAKIFSECTDCFDKVVESADVDEDVQVKFEGDKMKVMSITFGKPIRTFSEDGDETPDDEPNTDLTEIIDSANKLAEMADAGITKENADEIKTLAEEIINKAEAAENDEVSLMCVKKMCGKFSEEAAAVADAADETVEDEIETKVESNANPQVKQCEETGKWFIEEDPEKKLYDTQEEANEVAAREFSRQFSDPKVTVTIEDLEPASVGSLLGYENKTEEPKDEELEPKVNPNEGGAGRQFSMTAPKKSINPLLHTEIN